MPKYEYVELDIDSLLPNPLRTKNPPTRESIMRLADSIRQYGLFTPILVGDTSAGKQIISGERRWRAAKIAGLTKIPAMVVRASSLELMILFWEENMERENMNLIEQAKLVAKLLERDGFTPKIISSRLTITLEEIEFLKKVLRLPIGIQDKYLRNEISDQELREIIENGDVLASMH